MTDDSSVKTIHSLIAKKILDAYDYIGYDRPTKVVAFAGSITYPTLDVLNMISIRYTSDIQIAQYMEFFINRRQLVADLYSKLRFVRYSHSQPRYSHIDIISGLLRNDIGVMLDRLVTLYGNIPNNSTNASDYVVNVDMDDIPEPYNNMDSSLGIEPVTYESLYKPAKMLTVNELLFAMSELPTFDSNTYHANHLIYKTFTITPKNILLAIILIDGTVILNDILVLYLCMTGNNKSLELLGKLIKIVTQYKSNLIYNLDVSENRNNRQIINDPNISLNIIETRTLTRTMRLIYDLLVKIRNGDPKYNYNVKSIMKLVYVCAVRVCGYRYKPGTSHCLFDMFNNIMINDIVSKIFMDSKREVDLAYASGFRSGFTMSSAFLMAGYNIDIKSGIYIKHVDIKPEIFIHEGKYYKFPEKAMDDYYISRISINTRYLQDNRILVSATGRHPNISDGGSACLGDEYMMELSTMLKSKPGDEEDGGDYYAIVTEKLLDIERVLSVVNFDSAYEGIYRNKKIRVDDISDLRITDTMCISESAKRNTTVVLRKV